MRKTLMFLLIITLLLSLAIFGCSKNKSTNNGNGDGILNPQDYDFGLIVYDLGFRNTYEIEVTNWDWENPITDVQLNINGNPVTIQSGLGEYDFTPGQTYNFDLTIGRAVYDFDLQINSNLFVNWPETYDPSQATTVNWTQLEDPDYQDFFLEGYDMSWDEYEYEYEVLNNSARSFTIPANWIGSSWFEYYMSLWSVNYTVSGNLIAASESSDGMSYYYETKGVKTDFNRLERFQKFIEKIK